MVANEAGFIAGTAGVMFGMTLIVSRTYPYLCHEQLKVFLPILCTVVPV